MKQGEVLNGYTVASKPTNAGGGKCVWAFATRGDQEFFIKEFLEPKWPLDSSPGSASSKEKRRAECVTFEWRHQHVMDRLKSDDIGGGNIVIAEAFFREATTYYKVTKRIDASNLASLAALTTRQKAVVLRTLVLSLQQLHRIGIVHGDLKPDNVLVQKRPRNDLYTAKLIDFDDSYFAGEPPEPGTVVGDTLYGAPEWLDYIKDKSGAGGAALTTAVDMFALGLMLHEYLTGQRPGFSAAFSSPGEAVKAGEQLSLNPRLHPAISRLVRSLIDVRPLQRPRIEAFLKAVEDESILEFPSSAAPDPADPSRPSRLQINIRPGDSARGPTARPTSPAASTSPAPVPHDDSAAHGPRRSRVRIHVDPHVPESRPPERGVRPPER